MPQIRCHGHQSAPEKPWSSQPVAAEQPGQDVKQPNDEENPEQVVGDQMGLSRKSQMWVMVKMIEPFRLRMTTRKIITKMIRMHHYKQI